jgi:hypothetical protein
MAYGYTYYITDKVHTRTRIKNNKASKTTTPKKVNNSSKLHLALSPAISKKKSKTPSITEGLRRNLRIKRSMDGYRWKPISCCRRGKQLLVKFPFLFLDQLNSFL